MPPTPGHGEELFALLGFAFRAAVDDLHRRLAVGGFDDVRPAHGFAFSRLSPDGATATELADHLGLTRQAVTQMVDELERRSYVERRPDPNDRRAKRVLLTARGRACVALAIESMDAIAADWESRAGASASTELRAALRSVLAGEAPSQSRGLRPAW